MYDDVLCLFEVFILTKCSYILNDAQWCTWAWKAGCGMCGTAGEIFSNCVWICVVSLF